MQDCSTDFEFLPIDVSLGRCLRYFQKYTVKGTFGARTSTSVEGIFLFNTPMRADPSASQITVAQTYDLFGNPHDQSSVDINVVANTEKGIFLYWGNFTGMTQGRIMNMYGGITHLSSEL